MSKRCPMCDEIFPDIDSFCAEHGELLVPLQAETAAEDETRMDPDNILKVEPDSVDDTVQRDALEAPLEPRAVDSVKAAAGVSSTLDRILRRLKPDFSQDSILPEAEQEAGWQLEGPMTPHPAFDRWPLSHADGRSGAFTRYRAGALTSAEVYERLEASHELPVPPLYSRGTVTRGGLALAYEITARADGQGLEQWLRIHTSLEAAQALAGALVALLRDLRAHGLRPITLEPSMLQIMDNRLTLAVLGGLTEATATGFHDYLARSPLIAAPWAAPELIERHVASPTGDIFSLGQIVASMLFGEVLQYDSLQNARVPFQKIEDPALRRLVMGALWPHEDGRWTIEDVEKNDGPLPPWDNLRPGAAANAFSLGGVSYWYAPDLVLAASAHWDEAVARFRELTAWLETTAYAAHARSLAAHSHRSSDWQLVHLCRLIAPDAPIFWRNHSLSDEDAEESLARLAQTALDGTDAEAREELESLFASDLRGAFSGRARC